MTHSCVWRSVVWVVHAWAQTLPPPLSCLSHLRFCHHHCCYPSDLCFTAFIMSASWARISLNPLCPPLCGNQMVELILLLDAVRFWACRIAVRHFMNILDISILGHPKFLDQPSFVGHVTQYVVLHRRCMAQREGVKLEWEVEVDGRVAREFFDYLRSLFRFLLVIVDLSYSWTSSAFWSDMDFLHLVVVLLPNSV